jgi:hypothetical protein
MAQAGKQIPAISRLQFTENSEGSLLLRSNHAPSGQNPSPTILNTTTARVSPAPASLGSRSPIGYGFGKRLIRFVYGQQNRGLGARHSASARGRTERGRADVIRQVRN